ncbi:MULTISPECIES: hypothetical protein [unclassified Mesorhizobium]|uniref:hypothetical protein n=1 Tax=unclassified Mesorhizobium TaxID=325217 RepID=UPI000FD70319|nr:MULTISPECIES: hypothetical protein [unclassified Mesorhizobium]TGQ08690.1 hypothetical protein EN862_020785 [Mesorhizobium sp. M2E.F.Ca.ET.219.01.1.1]TGT69225.1 hypothetical protein EN809_023065 [Mesorhizobium sp. M2E.F.Ca.ET.166.01.1.1]TGW01557.1 hypothetical protein EN797_014560 [Mesorhizobium sp. M2E.F.Ca.ET.154.01.1.1]
MISSRHGQLLRMNEYRDARGQRREHIHVKRSHRKYDSTDYARGCRARSDGPGVFRKSEAKAERPAAEIRALIETHIKAFNAQDNKLLFSVFSDTAIIIDGIAPFCWLNPDAPAKWMADAEK